MADAVRKFDLMQLRLTGDRLEIESTQRFDPDAVIPGWVVVNRPINQGVFDGEDLLTGFVASRPGGVHGSGVCRWLCGAKAGGRSNMSGYAI